MGGLGVESLFTGAITGTVAVSNFPATQPISAAALPLPAGASTAALQTQPGVDIGDVTVNNAAGAAAVNIQDGGNSITVDGVFFQATQPISAAALPLPAGAATSALQTQPGVDIGDVTINNAAGASAVNIQDGGNSITVDGTVTTTPPANASTNVAQLAGTTTDTNSGAKSAGTLRVVLATDQPQLTNKLLVTPDSVALPANQSVNVNQFAGTGAQTGSGNATGALRVELANNGTGVLATVGAVTAITNALPTGANILGSVNGDVDHDAVNTLKQIQVAGNANPCDVPPTAVSANGDRVRVWYDRYGSPVIRRRKIRESYTVAFRLAEAAARLDQTFTHVANTNKQWMTLHHTAAATKELRLTRWVVYLTSFTAASQAILELRQLSVTTPPATGNPAITPTPRRQGGTAAEATALYLPTTQGSELAVNSPITSRVYDLGIMGAATLLNPTPEIEIVMYDATLDDDEVLPPTFPVGAYAGLAVMLRTVGTPTVRMSGVATFTEEVP